jgi:hypothetical protein
MGSISSIAKSKQSTGITLHLFSFLLKQGKGPGCLR